MSDREKQFLKAYDDYSDAIFRYCYYRIFDKEKAKDFVQETYYRTWKYMINSKDIENIRALLYRIANNIIIDESRKKKNSSLDQMMENGFMPKVDNRQKTEDYFTGKEVILIVKALEEKYRDVILMKYIKGLSTPEIAIAVNETENNVYVRISRGLEKVKEILKKQNKWKTN
jgi:RNA polymerase sigma-70 factor (ECF subfamily)